MVNGSTPVPWLPLLALCPACKNTGHHSHEPHRVLAPLFDVLNVTARHGVVIDGGTSFDMTEGVFALKRGFKVIGIEARSTVYAALLAKHNQSVAMGELTLLHAALGDRAGGFTYIYNAHDATSTSLAAAGRYVERRNPLMKEAVATTTLDSLVGDGEPCAMIKLDVQGAVRGPRARARASVEACIHMFVCFTL